MSQNKIPEKEVIEKMAKSAYDKIKEERDRKNAMKAQEGEGANPTTEATNEATEATTATPAEGVTVTTGTTTEEVQTTSEFDTKGTEPEPTKTINTKKEKEEVTADTEGVFEYVEYPISDDNKMPATNGMRASQPIATWKTKRKGPQEGTEIIIRHGRFLKNVNGEAVKEEDTEVTRANPEDMGAAKKYVNKLATEVQNIAQNISNPTAAKLRQFMSQHSYIIFSVTDKNDTPIIRQSIKKNENGQPESVSMKVAMSGTGTVDSMYVVVPDRAYDTLTSGNVSDTELVSEILAETQPTLKMIRVKKDEITHFVGAYTHDGLKVRKEMISQIDCNKVISDDPTKGVVPKLIAKHVQKTYKQNPTEEERKAILKRQEKEAEKLKKATEHYGNSIDAKLALSFRLENTASNKLVSPTAYIPKRTIDTIPAGNKFNENAGMTREEATNIYLTHNIKKNFSGNSTLDALKVTHKDDRRPFLFDFELLPGGVGYNPVFYKSETSCLVEPYFSTFDEVKGKAAKSRTNILLAISKKIPNKKQDGYVLASHPMDDPGYNTRLYEAVKQRYNSIEELSNVIPFPSLEQIRIDCAKTKAAKSSSKRSGSNIDLFSQYDPFTLASIQDTNPEVFGEYQNAVSRQKAIARDDATKVTMWQGVYNRRLKKALEAD